jgi:CheY-like chemotaxis protein
MMRLGTLIDTDEATETGIAIYKRLRQVAPNLPVLVLSALSKDHFWQQSSFANDSHATYFGKPLKAEDKIYLLVEGALK